MTASASSTPRHVIAARILLASRSYYAPRREQTTL